MKWEVLVKTPTLDRVAAKVKDTRGLFAAIAVEVHKKVMENFEAEGIWKKWAPNKPSTLFGRRSGGGMILQDTGGLKASFRFDYNDKEATVGSPLKIALYHQEGRKGPWVIRPRRAKALAFPWQGGGKVAEGGFKSFGHLKRSGEYRKGDFMVVKKVIHPGYPARPMLPTGKDAEDLVNSVAKEYYNMVVEGSA